MTSPPSGSDPAVAYERLHPGVKAWIWDQQWTQLRPTQAQAVGPVLDGARDVIISAATAGGKTEAAWLPICSALGFEREVGAALPGVKALYIGPLKALINDQHGRLTSLFAHIDLPVIRRHGDVTGRERAALTKAPDGVVLITPEALEALFVVHGHAVPAILGGLRYIVIDELHAFIGTERGAQLQSLLHRAELAIRRRVPRVALSATLGDMAMAAAYLRPGDGERVVLVAPDAEGEAELRMQLRGYRKGARPDRRAAPEAIVEPPAPPGDADAPADDDLATERAIARHLFATMRGNDNLVFANSRGNVETYADLLREMCEEARLPLEFHAHHGSLSRDHREQVEALLKSPDQPTTAICTSTLEMGIDIGSVDAVAQVGAPARVASLRQRMGRSGRRGGPAVLRLYVTEDALDRTTATGDLLRLQTVETIAVIDLLLEQWYEPPDLAGLHLSTLVQQILSVIAQHGGATAAAMHRALCAAGPFARVTQRQFVRLLRDLAGNDILTQADDGLLLPGVKGERLLNHYSFFSAFQTPEEYRLVAAGRTIGSMPIVTPQIPGNYLIFGGRRWRVIGVDSASKVIELERARGGRVPLFSGSPIAVSNEVRRRMRAIYLRDDVPPYLDREAERLLREGREGFRQLGLATSCVRSDGRDVELFPWTGDRVVNTLIVALTASGLKTGGRAGVLTCEGTGQEAMLALMARLLDGPLPDPVALAAQVPDKVREKHDGLLSEELLREAYAARDLDVHGAWRALAAMLGREDAEEVDRGR